MVGNKETESPLQSHHFHFSLEMISVRTSGSTWRLASMLFHCIILYFVACTESQQDKAGNKVNQWKIKAPSVLFVWSCVSVNAGWEMKEMVRVG